MIENMYEVNDKKEKKFDYIPLLAFIGFYILESFSATIGSRFINAENNYSLLWMISKIIPLMAIIVIYMKRFGSLAKDTFKNFGKFMLYSLVSFIVFYGFEIGATQYQLLMNKLLNIGEASNQETINDLFTSSSAISNYIFLFVTIVLVAPLIEEFEYRELIFKTFKGFHFLVPALISTLLFGLAHTLQFILTGEFNQVYFLPVYMLPGFCLSLIYHYSNNNFYCSYLVHLTSNLISFMVIISEISQGAPTVEI